jgi:hypothetical protein
MKRRLLLFLAIVVSGALPLSAWADVSLVKTSDGTEFKFGMATKFNTFTLGDLDLAPGFNFRSFVSPDTTLGDTSLGILNYNNLLFTLERGPLRIHANLEIESNIDAAAVDVNNPNMERFSLYYKFEDFGTLAVGYDVHAFDPEGVLIYTDEHPGVWLVGGDENISWDVAWHLVANCNRGASLFSNGGNFCPTTATGLAGQSAAATKKSFMNNMFLARVNFNVADGTVVSPMIVYSARHVPQSGLLNEFSDPIGGISAASLLGAAFPTGVEVDGKSDQFRPGAVVKSDVADGVHLTFEGVGLFGKVKNAGGGFLSDKAGRCVGCAGAGTLPTDTQDFTLSSFAMFFEVALDGDTLGLPPGLTTYFSGEWHSGDNDPFDDKYSGYVPISNLSAALRKDGFKGQSISAFGPATLGANSEDGWGFDVTARGTGATLGTIVPDETLGVVSGGLDPVGFNNRGGKGGNPGFFKLNGGIIGKINSKWDTHVGISAFWFNHSKAIEAEAAQDILGRLEAAGAAPCGAGVCDPRIGTPSSPGATHAVAGALDMANFMGVEINANIGYAVTGGLRVQPWVSVFIPGSGVDDINQAFLSSTSDLAAFAASPSTSTLPPSQDANTGFAAGIEMSAAF